jgi:hypothetical protein
VSGVYLGRVFDRREEGKVEPRETRALGERKPAT